MLRPTIIATLVTLIVTLAGCGGKSAAAPDHDRNIPNIATAGPVVEARLMSMKRADPVDPPPVLDPWMKVPPLTLKAKVDRLLRCGGSDQSHRRCNLSYHEGAWAQSPTEEQGRQHYAVRTWMTVPAAIYDRPPTKPLPRAPFRVAHYLLPHWHEADAWLTFALRNARRICGMQTRVSNALVHIDADIGIENTYVVTLELSPYRPSVERSHAECVAGEDESNTDRRADAIATGKPWNATSR